MHVSHLHNPLQTPQYTALTLLDNISTHLSCTQDKQRIKMNKQCAKTNHGQWPTMYKGKQLTNTINVHHIITQHTKNACIPPAQSSTNTAIYCSNTAQHYIITVVLQNANRHCAKTAQHTTNACFPQTSCTNMGRVFLPSETLSQAVFHITIKYTLHKYMMFFCWAILQIMARPQVKALSYGHIGSAGDWALVLSIVFVCYRLMMF
jgi:hypothetical protein